MGSVGAPGAPDQALSAGARLLQRIRARRGDNGDPTSAQELEKELAALVKEQPVTLREFEQFRRELAAQASVAKVQVTSFGNHAVLHQPTFGFVEGA